MATEISVNKQSVKDLLSSGKEKNFVIPEYQRPYAWTDEQIETLFDDLWNFTSNKGNDSQTTYFLGSIVSYDNEKGEQEIIDGQQRITSLFLLLRAIYTKLMSIPERTKEANNFIQQIEPAIWKTDNLTGEVNYSEILLKSNVINDEGNKILKGILETGKTEDNAKDNYSKNYNKFLELFEKASKDDPLKIYEFIYDLLNRAILLPISADNQDTALTIFSTLNNRGLPLSDADIFKAKIYNNISDTSKRNDFITYWKEIEDSAQDAGESIQQLFYYYMFYLRAVDGDIKTTTPGLRKYFSENKFIRLYDDKLLNNLNLILNFWTVVNKREALENEKWSENIEILKALDILCSYPNEFWKYPVIIYYLKNRENIDFENNFLLFLRRFLVLLLVKYLEIPTINAVKNDILKLNAEIVNIEYPRFNKLELDGNEFKERLKVPHSNTVRMLLKIMAYKENNQDTLLPYKWEIEHIFPQKWHNNYFQNNDKNDEEIKREIEHLGNKIPFEKKLNIEAGNGYFGKKKAYYSASNIEVAKNLSKLQQEDWDLNDIADRDTEVSILIQSILSRWISDYDHNGNHNLKEEPSEDDLKKIEEYRSKGWL